MSAKPATDEAVRKLSEELAGADSNHSLVTGVGRVRRLVSRIDADAARIAALEEALRDLLDDCSQSASPAVAEHARALLEAKP